MQALLDAHPNIAIAPESRFILHLFSRYADKHNWSTRDKKRFFEDLQTDEKFTSFWNVDLTRAKSDLMNMPSNSTYGEMVKCVSTFHMSMFHKEEVKIIGNKNPIHSLFIPELIDLFPDAKFIHLVRDPRGCVSSQRKMKPNQSIQELSHRWNYFNSVIDDSKTAIPDQFTTVRYEDLLTEPDRVVEKLMNFIGLPFHNAQLEFHNTVGKVIHQLQQDEPTTKTNLFLEHFSKLAQPIVAANVSSWKDRLSEKEVEDIERICFQTAICYGYQVKKPPGDIPMYLDERKKMLKRVKKMQVYYRLPFRARRFLQNR